MQVTLTGGDFIEASDVTWNNQTLFINSASDTQIVVTIPASSLTTAEASGITVTNGPGTGSSNSLGFTVLPHLGTNTQISTMDISGHDLAWDSSRSLLYVAVPASDPALPNTIAVVDPTKTAINQTVPVADGPTAISLSDDGQSSNPASPDRLSFSVTHCRPSHWISRFRLALSFLGMERELLIAVLSPSMSRLRPAILTRLQ